MRKDFKILYCFCVIVCAFGFEFFRKIKDTLFYVIVMLCLGRDSKKNVI